MNISKILFIMAMGMLLIAIDGNAQSQTAHNDSTVNAIKIKNLKNRKTSLQSQIAREDKKRNAVIDGVSPETLEKRNDKQDSICLALRSELTDVELELKELKADNTTAQIAEQYNGLVHNNHQDSTQVAVPVKPTKPNKPEKPAKKK